eukprot:877993-Pelagomonas_calceolata.AAC.1
MGRCLVILSPCKKKRLHRQKKLSLHQFRKRRHIGSEEPRASSTTKLQLFFERRKANGDLEIYRKHPAPEPGCEKHHYFP